jgi:hypothetical protein
MAVRALQGLILCLAVVAGIEIGYLSRPPAPEPRVVFTEAAPAMSASVPACASAEPTPTALVSAEPPPAPRRRPRHRPETAQQIPDTRSVSDCARNGGPLCGMPK